MQNDDIVGRWNYGATPQFPYGEETSYRKAMAFLDGPYVIADPVRPAFEVGSVSEILAVQPFGWCVAHQSWNALGGEDPIAIWFRLLKPGGKLVLELGHRDGVNTDALSRVGFTGIKVDLQRGHVEALKP